MDGQTCHEQVKEVMEGLESGLTRGAFGEVRDLLLEYVSSAGLIPRYAFFLIRRILSYPELLQLAVELAGIAIERNTPEALERFSPGMGTPVKVADLYKDLYSQRAWARWKLDDVVGAWEDLQTAVAYRDRFAKPGRYGAVHPTAVDWLRLGIVGSRVEDADAGWEQVKQGIVLDRTAVDSDPAYVPAITALIHERFGPDARLKQVMAQILEAEIRPVPNVGLTGPDGESVAWFSSERPTLVVFFSPMCGSCQRELRALKPLYDEGNGQSARWVFLLNKPQREPEAVHLLEQAGYPGSRVCRVKDGSAFDHISEEPTTWLVDPAGKTVRVFTGYREGDEELCREALAQLVEATRCRGPGA